VGIMLTLTLLSLVAIAEGAERQSDDWFIMVVEIERHIEGLDRTDQRFVRAMVNKLTADLDATPTAPQQRWLLDIKRRIDAGEVRESKP
jgi:hypothetical protein